MSGMLLSLGLNFTFPSVVMEELPTFFGYPYLEVGFTSKDKGYMGFGIGGMRFAVGGQTFEILTSSVYVGTFVGDWEVSVGLSAASVGLSSLGIEDQGYLGVMFTGGYGRRLGPVRVSGGVFLSVYPTFSEGRLSVVPVPLFYLKLSP